MCKVEKKEGTEEYTDSEKLRQGGLLNSLRLMQNTEVVQTYSLLWS